MMIYCVVFGLTAMPSRFLGAFKKGIEADIPSAAMRMEKALAQVRAERTTTAYIIFELWISRDFSWLHKKNKLEETIFRV
jgi:hypothetical protein